MSTKVEDKLTATEITSLWQQYVADSLDICIKKHVLAHVEDPDIRSVFRYAMNLSEKHLKQVETFLNREHYPLPVGFTDRDVHRDAPRLYSDAFWLKYIQIMSANALPTLALVITTAIRPDIREYFTHCFSDTEKLYGKATEMLEAKGILTKPPHLPTPEHAETMKPEGLMSRLFGEAEPLNGFEISHIFFNLQKTDMVAALVLGFSRVLQDEKSREIGQKMAKLAKKHSELFQEVLLKERVPLPKTWESEITTSVTPPFSDKLMLTHVTMSLSSAIQYYGAALSMTMRPDLVRHYMTVITRDLTVTAETGQLMTEYGWIEQPPQLPDRS